tara:strand:+ start:225 stop:380 length:156 start_codon:yes stop_codon:yes gene_type:complete
VINVEKINKRKVVFWILFVGCFLLSTALIYAASPGWPKISLNSPASFPTDI